MARLLVALALLALPGVVTAAPSAAVTEFRYTSEPGDYVGNGASHVYGAGDASFVITGTKERLTVTVEADGELPWSIELAAPVGEELHPGKYLDAERVSFKTGRSPGLEVIGNAAGCSEIWGKFVIHQIEANESGEVTLLDVTFIQHCESPTTPPLRGAIRVDALPQSFAFVSEAGDTIGNGESKEYTGATSLFSLTGNRRFLRFEISGRHDRWTLDLRAPQGKRLRRKTYPTERAFNGDHALLDFSGNGRGCSNSTGSVTIEDIVHDTHGKVTGLRASFEQHCQGDVPALLGEVEYYE